MFSHDSLTTVLDREPLPTGNRTLLAQVRRVARLTAPERVVWCRPAEFSSVSLPLSATPPALPVDLRDRTIVAARRPRTAPVEPGLRDPDELDELVALSFEDCMRGRTLWVVPFLTDGADGRALPGLQLTDSRWVAARLEAAAREQALDYSAFEVVDRPAIAVHSVGYPLVLPGGATRPDLEWPHATRPWVAQFPTQGHTWTFGTAYEPRLVPAVALLDNRMVAVA